MDKLVEHAIRMLEIVEDERAFYKDLDGDVADIAQAVYDTILRVQVLERKADRKTESIIYGNEHNCIMTLFGDCSYNETGCGSCAVVEKVRNALGKTEPNNSEKPNNCDTCRNKGFEGCEQPCLGCGCCGLYEPKDEPTTQTETQNSNLTFEKSDDPQAVEPNLILPETMERGEMYEVGNTIVVMNSQDYYDLLCKSWTDEPQAEREDE